jgi:SAM-dependent methyltransferase
MKVPEKQDEAGTSCGDLSNVLLCTQGARSCDSDLEAVFCDCCGSDTTRLICRRPDGLRVVECLRCGLAYLNPRPGRQAISRLYGRDYFFKSGRVTARIGCDCYDVPAAVPLGFPQLDVLERFCQLRKSRLLEVGCATGALLAEAHRRGAHVVGLDLSEYVVEIARRNTGLEVRAGSLESAGGTIGTFDVVLAFEVIEHVPSPRSFLSHVANAVRSGGIVMLSTPNYRCARRFGANWLGFHASFQHLYFFSDEVLARMASIHGLKEVCWFTAGDGECRVGPSEVRTRAKKLIKRVPGFMKLWGAVSPVFKPQRPDYWGQGHCLTTLFRKCS